MWISKAKHIIKSVFKTFAQKIKIIHIVIIVQRYISLIFLPFHNIHCSNCMIKFHFVGIFLRIIFISPLSNIPIFAFLPII